MDLDFESPRKIAKSLSRHLKIDVARKTIEIRERQVDFPHKIRNNIEELKTETNPQVFVDTIEDSLLKMIEESILDRKGLPCAEAELEVAIRFFPNALWYPLEHIYISVGPKKRELLPHKNLIHFVPFVPLFAKLGVESGWYSDNERGGLMTYRLGYGAAGIHGKRFNLLEYICLWFLSDNSWSDREQLKREAIRIDRICLGAMKGLRERGVFDKKDIIDFNLIEYIIKLQWKGMHEERLRYLLGWCPEAALAKIKEEGRSVEDEDEEMAALDPVNKKLRCRYH